MREKKKKSGGACCGVPSRRYDTSEEHTRLYNRWIKDIIHSRDYYTQHMHIIKLITGCGTVVRGTPDLARPVRIQLSIINTQCV